jgi:hypothetical protein
MAERRHRAGRILIGIGVMIILAALPFLILSRYAGGWGVPYFSFTTDRGSVCTNDLTGYHCDRLTLADVRWWGDLDLPDGTTVVSSHYKSTHDFTLDAVLEVPKADAAKTYLALRKAFGPCVADHPSRLDASGLGQLCVMANDASDGMESSEPRGDTLYEIGTGIRKSDGVRVIAVHEESR